MSKHVVIVGAGVMGLNAAVELARHDALAVTVIDSGFPGGGSTSRSVGVYTNQYLTRRDVELRVRSNARISELEETAGLTVRRIGYVRVGRDEAATASFHASIALQRELGPCDARVIDAEELGRLVPHFERTGVVSALYAPGEGYVDGAELCTLLAEQAQALGATVMVRAGLRAARRRSGGGYVLQTDRGELQADLVVNCAGAWCAEVGALLEAPVGVVNERHEAYVFELPRTVDYTVPMLMDYMPSSAADEGLYFRQEGEHQLIAGLHTSVFLDQDLVTDPSALYTGTTQAGVDAIVERLDAALPTLDGLAYRDGWAGIYPHSPDGRPIAGPHPDAPDVLVGCGLGGTGISLAPAMGRLLAEWAIDGEPRFIEGALDMAPREAVVRAGA